jgi:hypothetical protein
VPTIPIPPGYKSSFIDSRTKIKLVTDALVSAQADAFAGVLILESTEENKLAQLQRHEIVRTLESIQKANNDLFQVLPDLSTWVDNPPERNIWEEHLDEQFGPKWRKMLEAGAVVLRLRRGFDNWCEAQRYKKSMTVANLSLENREKVLATVSAIYERFELTSNPSVSIRFERTIGIDSYEARKLSLEFLKNKDSRSSRSITIRASVSPPLCFASWDTRPAALLPSMRRKLAPLRRFALVPADDLFFFIVVEEFGWRRHILTLLTQLDNHRPQLCANYNCSCGTDCEAAG